MELVLYKLHDTRQKKKKERERSKDELNDENAWVKRQSTGLKAQRR